MLDSACILGHLLNANLKIAVVNLFNLKVAIVKETQAEKEIVILGRD